MKLRSFQWIAMASALGASALLPGCGKRKAEEVNPIVPQFSVNLPRAPLGSAIEVTYSWTCEAGMKKLEDQRAFVHFVDNQGSTLFTDEISKKPPVIALDLAELSYIDSSGIGSLIRYMNMATKENINFLCYNLNKNIENIFKISKLDHFLPILSNEAFQKKYYNLCIATKNN